MISSVLPVDCKAEFCNIGSGEEPEPGIREERLLRYIEARIAIFVRVPTRSRV